MAEALSQSEIDNLLNSLTSGAEVEEPAEEIKTQTQKKVKNYDFKSPKKISKEQLKVLMGIHENFARHLSSYFSGILRTYCEISIVGIEEQPYYEYNNALPDSILIGVMDVRPIEGPVLVDISNSITFTLVERILGGNGDGLTPEREFTEIEVSLMERVFKQIAVSTKDAWATLMAVESSLKEIETNSRLIQVMPMDEVVVLVVLDVSIGKIRGNINLCIPCINLESIIDQLNQNKFHKKRIGVTDAEDGVKEAMTSRIKEAPLVANVVFGETVLTLREVLNLQYGDVIKINQTVDSNVRIDIDGKGWFYGIPGVKKNKKVVKVMKVV